MQISSDLKSGYVTQTQATTLRAQVRAIRQQVLDNIKLNGAVTLTTNQVQQLNQMLDSNATSLSTLK